MIHYNFGDIILVKFPFTNQETKKQRPAIVISSKIYNQNRPDIILMAITSKIREPLEIGEIKIEQWREAGLLKPSLFKPIIATIEKDYVIKTLGKASNQDKSRLTEILNAIINFS